jgi:hypothetical protein
MAPDQANASGLAVLACVATHPAATEAMTPLYHILTTAGLIRIHARNRAAAILSALELAGPNAKLVSTTKPGEW